MRGQSGLWDSLLALLFPATCVGCGRRGQLLCSTCLASAEAIQPPICLKCGRPDLQGGPCPFCQRYALCIDAIRSPFLFSGAIREAIHALKYRGLSALANPLGELLARYLEQNPLPTEVVVPVPLHPQRARERGYNQAELLARRLAKERSLPLDTRLLTRQRPTPPQVQATNAEERQANMVGAFAVAGQSLPYRAVLLIDDVCTTGATLDACSRSLKDCGVTTVWGLTLAREG